MSILKRAGPTCLLILPIYFLISMYWVRIHGGPFWLAINRDPEYPFLLNSLNLTEFKAVGMYLHPGTTVEIFGFLILTLLRFGSFQGSSEALRTDLLKNPDLYLTLITVSICVVTALTLFLTGLLTYKKSKSLGLSLFVQLTPFLVPYIFFWYTDRFCCEPFLIIISLWINYLLLTQFLAPKRNDNKFGVTLGILIGLSLVTKMAGLPLLLLPIFVISHRKILAASYGSVILTFFVVTRPIWGRFRMLVPQLAGFVTHTGSYGSGKLGLFDTNTSIRGVSSMYSVAPFLFWSTTIAVGCAIAVKVEKVAIEKSTFKALFGIVAIILVQIAMVSKYPDMPYYLTPIVPLTGTLLFLVWKLSQQLHVKIVKRCLAIVVAVSIVVSLFDMLEISNSLFHSERNGVEQSAGVVKIEIDNKFKDCAQVTYYPYSLDGALMFGNEKALDLYSKDLESLYPHNYYYDIFEKTVRSWTGKLSLDDLKQKYKCVVFLGMPFADKLIEGKQPEGLQIVAESKFHALYKLNY